MTERPTAPVYVPHAAGARFFSQPGLTFLCAGRSDGFYDTCQGDSGGPLFVRASSEPEIFVQVGITSFGIGNVSCGDPETPAMSAAHSTLAPTLP